MMNLLLVVVLVISLSFVAAQEWSTVIYENDKYEAISGQNTSGVAWGYYTDDVEQDGWGKLLIESNGAYSGKMQMYASGYLEGVLTNERISNYHTNFMANQFGGSRPPKRLMEFAGENYQSMKNQSLQGGPYWWHVGRILDQLQGLYDGYISASSSTVHFIEILLMNLSGDLDDLQSIFPNEEEEKHLKNWENWSHHELEDSLMKRGRCSVLVKVTADLSDLMIAHTTWGSYWTMQRIWKTYNFNLKHSKSSGMSFSGYPGILVSFDDYFIMKDTNLVVTETTNSVVNYTLYTGNININSVMYWIRAFVANRMASSGKEWVEIFGENNSGTYNNQWIVVDYKLFTPGQEVVNNTLWISEQMPGGYFMQDVSQVLRYGYWPSYNRPYFTEVFAAMGYNYCVSKWGDIYSYELNPRAEIFRRDQDNVEYLDDMMYIMQYNNYLTDPLSGGYAGNTISSRFDLKGGPNAPPPNANWFSYGTHGGIDSKITNSKLALQNQAMIISGPTHLIPSVTPPFDWSAWNNQSHVGLPQVFNFTWVAV